MRSILNHFVHHHRPFRPKTLEEVFALRLARTLGDESAIAQYAALLSEHSLDRLLAAYRRVLKSGAKSDLSSRFRAELQRGNCRTSFPDDIRLIAIKVERRSVAAAIFIGRHLEHTDVRHLSSQAKRAELSSIEFINRIATGFDVQSAAVESSPSETVIRRTALSRAVIQACIQAHALPLWQLSKKQLFESFGHPALGSRKELREVILSMWPVLNDTPRLDQALDAVALGAVVQVERLFLH